MNKEEQILLCFNRSIDPDEVARLILKETGIKVMAEDPKDTVNGYVNGYHFKEGFKGVCKHGMKIEGPHTCFEVFFYDVDKKPDNIEWIGEDGKRVKDTGHKSTLKAVNLTKAKKEKIEGFIMKTRPDVAGLVKM